MKKLLTCILAVSFLLVAVLPSLVEARRSSSSRSYSSSSRSSSRSYSRPTKSYSAPRKSYSSRTTKKSYSKPKRRISKSTATKKPFRAKAKSSVAKTRKAKRPSIRQKARSSQKKYTPKYSSKNTKKRRFYSKNNNSYKNNKRSKRKVTKIVKNYNVTNYNTYGSRRDSFYSGYGYVTPFYARHTYSSFGVWDSLFLWMMLDRMHEPRYAAMYYNHADDPGMVQWRREASKLSRKNKELEAKLNRLDGEMGKLKGTKKIEDYVPKGVDADIMLSKETIDQFADDTTF